MKINKKSFHYRLIRLYTTPSSNLCTYFWEFIFFSFLTVLFLVFGLFVLPFALGNISIELVFTSLATLEANKYLLYTTLLGFVVFLLLAIIFLSCFTLYDKAVEFLYDMKKKSKKYDSESKKEPSLFSSYLKSKKEKYCAKITFEDD